MTRVSETLQQLVERRLYEMGMSRGRGESLKLLEVWHSLPEDERGKRPVSYETVRRIVRGEHRNIGDRAADALATMLDVPVGEVLKAAGQRPRLGRFDLPRRADRLNERERNVIVSVVDTILSAASAASSHEATGHAQLGDGRAGDPVRHAKRVRRERQGERADEAPEDRRRAQ